MIYLQNFYARRRDPISVGLQNAFQPMFDLTDAMTSALLRLDVNERRTRVTVPLVARVRRPEVRAGV